MANAIVRITDTDPNGEKSVMSKITVTTAGLLSLAEIPKEDSYTLRLWIKANGVKNVSAYIGRNPYLLSVNTAWKQFKNTGTATANSTCDLYLPTGTYYIWHPMLERSTKASDYRQAPEDVQENINTAANDAIESANAYTNEVLKEYSTTEEMRSEIQQTQEMISLSVSKQTTRSMTYAQTQANNALTAAKADTDNKLKSYVTTTKHSADLTLLSDRITSAVTATETLAAYVDGDFYNQITNEYSSAITQTANGIESRVRQTYATITTVNGIASRVTTAESSIKQNADSITSAVKRLGTAESKITQNANSISSLTSTVNGHSSAITQNANAIKLRVETSKLVSEINASSGQIKMTSNRFVVDSTYFKLSATGVVTASNLTLTGGSIKSANYATASDGSVTAGTYISLSTGAISTKNFKLTSAGTMTATSATLTSATITGTMRTLVNDSSYLYIQGNKMEVFLSSKRLAYITPVIYNGASEHQLGFMASGNYDGLTFGAAYDGGWEAYYTINIQDRKSRLNCRHWFAGDIKFTDGRVRSNLDFADNFGISWGGNIALRYYNSSSPVGVWLGIENSDACPTIITGSEIRLRQTAYTSSGVVVSSDARQKKNIKDLDERYTMMLENISAKTFQYKETNPDQTNCGFVAQDVLAAMKKAGLEIKDFGGFNDHYGDGREYSLDYMQFIPILWNIVKNQQKQINELRRNQL